MELCVLHYHFRPGGVRRVIELGLPALARTMGCTRVTMLAGEAPPANWRGQMEAALHPCAVQWDTSPALGYWSELCLSAAEARAAIRETLHRHAGPDIPLWAHNLSVGRNLLLAHEVATFPENFPRWLHHHDWWWDGRWERWPEFQAQGFATLTEAITATLPSGDAVRHLCVNLTDARRLTAWTGGAFHFLVNPATPPSVTREEVEDARNFVRRKTGAAQWWLYPCRGIRRKNIAEALLVQKWLAPGAVTITTGGPGRGEELRYFQRLTGKAAAADWPLHCGLAMQEAGPPVAALIAAADAVCVTSLKEGFGLPYGEAGFAARPCLARLPLGMEETLACLRVPFVRQWTSLPVSAASFDSAREAARAAYGRETLLALLPSELHAAARRAEIPGVRESVDFGALSLSAQFEVLDSSPKCPAGFQAAAPDTARPFVWPWTVESWAHNLLQVSGGRAWSSGWLVRAAEFIQPQLHHWLRHPLLWPEMREALPA